MFEIIICDDDDTCLRETNELVNIWSNEISAPVSIKAMSNVDKLIEYCGKNSPDVILLDIMMPFINGMDAAKEIRGKNTTSKIIFLTSSPEFAIESYDVEAAGYLLKPVNEARLFALLNKCLNEANRPMDSITLHTISGYQNVYLHNIEYLEAQNKKVIIALNDGSRLETASTLSFYEKQLTIDKGFSNATAAILYICRQSTILTTMRLLPRPVSSCLLQGAWGKCFRMLILHTCSANRDTGDRINA